jgi:hypothetical protein
MELKIGGLHLVSPKVEEPCYIALTSMTAVSGPQQSPCSLIKCFILKRIMNSCNTVNNPGVENEGMETPFSHSVKRIGARRVLWMGFTCF